MESDPTSQQDFGSPVPLVIKLQPHLCLPEIRPTLLFLSCLFFLRAAPKAYGSSQARGQIGAAAASLHHSHSNARSKPHPQPMPQLTTIAEL